MKLIVSILLGIALILAPVAGTPNAAAHDGAASSANCADEPCGCVDDGAAVQASCAAMCGSQVTPLEAKIVAPAILASRIAECPETTLYQVLSAPSPRPPRV